MHNRVFYQSLGKKRTRTSCIGGIPFGHGLSECGITNRHDSTSKGRRGFDRSKAKHRQIGFRMTFVLAIVRLGTILMMSRMSVVDMSHLTFANTYLKDQQLVFMTQCNGRWDVIDGTKYMSNDNGFGILEIYRIEYVRFMTTYSYIHEFMTTYSYIQRTGVINASKHASWTAQVDGSMSRGTGIRLYSSFHLVLSIVFHKFMTHVRTHDIQWFWSYLES